MPMTLEEAKQQEWYRDNLVPLLETLWSEEQERLLAARTRSALYSQQGRVALLTLLLTPPTRPEEPDAPVPQERFKDARTRQRLERWGVDRTD